MCVCEQRGHYRSATSRARVEGDLRAGRFGKPHWGVSLCAEVRATDACCRGERRPDGFDREHRLGARLGWGPARFRRPRYTASKGGVVNMTRELAAQWARRGVRVNAIAPGWFESEMTEDMFAAESGVRWIRKRTPMGRAGAEHELAGALLFLASDASSYVTGQTLAVDGG